jgi:hypothetical protein
MTITAEMKFSDAATAWLDMRDTLSHWRNMALGNTGKPYFPLLRLF